MNDVQTICLTIGYIAMLIFLSWSPNIRADSVYCHTGYDGLNDNYEGVTNLEPLNNGLLYQFNYDNKRYIVSTNRCIIEFDR